MDITLYESALKPVSEEDFKNAQENLMANMKQKSFYREKQFDVTDGGEITDDFTDENRRRSYYKNVDFIGATLRNTGFSGSIFSETSFQECIVENTKMDFCIFFDCHFLGNKGHDNEDIPFNYANFNQSIFLKGDFQDLIMQGTNLTGAVLEGVVFENCDWNSVCLEGTTFSNACLSNVNLHKLNFEFSTFINMKMDRVRIPFPTIPYIFNGLSYLMNTTDNICVSSAASETKSISVQEYLGYLDDLIKFYTKTTNYFPLANIFVSLERYDEAYAAIRAGIEMSMQKLRNFRLVYYYCKLLQLTEAFSYDQRAEVFDSIIQYSHLKGWTSIDFYNFSLYVDQIRNTLLNENNGDFMIFSINTNVLCNEFEKISVVYQTIEETIRLLQKEDGKRIVYLCEIRHNSPISFFIKAFSDPNTLSLLVTVFSAVFAIATHESDKKSVELMRSDINDIISRQNEIKSLYDILIEQNRRLIEENQKLREEIHSLKERLKINHIVIKNGNYYYNYYNAS